MAFKFKVALLILIAIVPFTFLLSEDVEYEETFSVMYSDSTIKAPDFALKSITGKTIKLSDYKGKIVVLDFWATWCPPCRDGIPDLIDLQNKFKDELIIIGISVDQERTINDVEPFAKYFGINYPIVYADYNVVMNYGWVQSYPTTFIIDQKGNVISGYVGLYPKYIYENEIKKLLAE